MIKKHVRSIFISDFHFGYGFNRSDHLTQFLRDYSCDTLYLVGDIFDFWVLKHRPRLKKSDVLAIRQVLSKIKQGSKVYYIPGNHDEVLRPHLDILHFEGITFKNEVTHVGVDGKKYLVTHGDIFDSSQPIWILLGHLGNAFYMWALRISYWNNKLREYFGWTKFSLSKMLKSKAKAAAGYVNKFEDHMIEYCKSGGYDGIICGHIHKAEMRDVQGIRYMNCGDFVESSTAIVEHLDGSFELINLE